MYTSYMYVVVVVGSSLSQRNWIISFPCSGRDGIRQTVRLCSAPKHAIF